MIGAYGRHAPRGRDPRILAMIFYPAVGVFAGPHVSAVLAKAAAPIHFAPDRWWPWLVAVLAAIFLIVFIWYVTQQVKFAPENRSETALADTNDLVWPHELCGQDAQ